MKEFIRSQWTKAMRSLAAAGATLDTDPDSAASRAYYAAFHGVTATLAGRGMEFTKHTAVRAALHRDLIQSGALSVDLGRDYDFLLDLRETADYGGVAELPSRVRRRRSRRHGRSWPRSSLFCRMALPERRRLVRLYASRCGTLQRKLPE